jgi:hypothetical protein
MAAPFLAARSAGYIGELQPRVSAGGRLRSRAGMNISQLIDSSGYWAQFTEALRRHWQAHA